MCIAIDKSFKLKTVYLAWRFNKNVILMPKCYFGGHMMSMSKKIIWKQFNCYQLMGDKMG